MLDLSNVWPELKAVEKLGEGSFGKVYKCEREEFGIKSVCAVKVISIPQSQEEIESMSFEGVTAEGARSYYSDVVNDFANEIKLMEMLKGAPNVVNVENFRIVERQNEIGWDIYIRMEYLQSFVAYSKNKKFTEDEVKKFALDISNALAVCSKSGVIHRDIKPDNIFVDRFGSFKLGDFGVARRLEGTMSVMSKKGTYSYMAPEVFRGEKYDNRADIYSLGMVMYKLLNRNRDPFIDMNAPVIGFKERNEAIERRRNGEKLPAPVDASPAMAAIILKACEFRADDRYASVEEFRTALNSLNAPVYADEPTVAARDFEEQTVAARDFDLTVAAPIQADCDEATVVMDDEPTAIDDSEATALADDEATVIADDEPTAIDNEETTVVAESDPDATLIADVPVDGDQAEKKKKNIALIIAVVVLLLFVAVACIWFFTDWFHKLKAGTKFSADSVAYNEDVGDIETLVEDDWTTESFSELLSENTNELFSEEVTEPETEMTTENEPVEVTDETTAKPTEKPTEHIVTEGEKLYLEAEKALKNGEIEKAAILFGKSSNYGYSDARDRSFDLWEKVKEGFGYSIDEIIVYSDGIQLIYPDGSGVTYYTDNPEAWRDVVAVATGVFDFAIGLKCDGTVVAVGDNTCNQCNVESWENIIAISAGGYHTVGLKLDGTVLAVGNNECVNDEGKGQCDVSDWENIVYIEASWWRTEARSSDGNEFMVGEWGDG